MECACHKEAYVETCDIRNPDIRDFNIEIDFYEGSIYLVWGDPLSLEPQHLTKLVELKGMSAFVEEMKVLVARHCVFDNEELPHEEDVQGSSVYFRQVPCLWLREEGALIALDAHWYKLMLPLFVEALRLATKDPMRNFKIVRQRGGDLSVTYPRKRRAKKAA